MWNILLIFLISKYKLPFYTIKFDEQIVRILYFNDVHVFYRNFGQRKRSNIPSDIETGIINLRSTYCPLTVLPTECLQQQVVPSTPNDEPVRTQILSVGHIG